MPKQNRLKTKYPGVTYIIGTSVSEGKPEKIYYIRYRRDGKLVEEKAGRQFQDDMTPARAAVLRAQRIDGNQLSNQAKRDAEMALLEAESNRWTIQRLWESYIAQRDLKGLAQDRSRYVNYIQPVFAEREPEEIAPLDVDRVRIQLLKSKSPQHVKHVLALFRRIINYGVSKRLCPPLSFKIELPSVDNQVTEDLAPGQLKALLKAIDEDHDINIKNMMRLALFTGMRRGELFRLEWQDIDFSRGFIRIRNPKGGKSQSIPMNQSAQSVLESHPRTESSFVFPGRNGRQRVEARRGVNRIKQRAGLPDSFRPLHGLRHAYASMLASSGEVDMYILQRLLTHKDPTTTQRYAHLRDEALRKASNLADNLVETVLNENDLKKRDG